jgi:hypothetical protein
MRLSERIGISHANLPQRPTGAHHDTPADAPRGGQRRKLGEAPALGADVGINYNEHPGFSRLEEPNSPSRREAQQRGRSLPTVRDPCQSVNHTRWSVLSACRRLEVLRHLGGVVLPHAAHPRLPGGVGEHGIGMSNYNPSSTRKPGTCWKSRRFREGSMASRAKTMLAIFKSVVPIRIHYLRSRCEMFAASVSHGSTFHSAKKAIRRWRR